MSKQADEKADEDRSPERLIAFSDGVYAVAITLLILSIPTPDIKDVPGSQLLGEILRQWPSWLGYIISFLAIGIGWINHHEIFRLIKRVDVTLLALNLLILLFTTIFPVPVRLLVEYRADADGLRVAAIFYGLVLVCLSISYFLVWYYATHASLLAQPLSPAVNRREAIRQILEILASGVAVAIAFFNAPVSIVLYVVLAMYFLITSYSRRFLRRPEQG